jgi:hypothetical protein
MPSIERNNATNANIVASAAYRRCGATEPAVR